MSTELIKSQGMPINEIMTMGKAFVESGMFPDVKSAAMAVVKIQAGQEIGIAPFAAMTGIHIIQGRPTIGAGLIASKVKSSGKYDYKVLEMSDTNCSLEFYEGKTSIGKSNFSIQDARKAQTKNIDKFPKNMLFARAISNGVKWFCPDVFSAPIYTPEEFDQVTEDVPATITTAKNGTEVNGHAKETTPPAPSKEEIEKVVTEPSDIDQEVKIEPIPGHWYAKLEKCKTPEDVDTLSLQHKETIQANPELKKLFLDTKATRRKTLSNPLPF